jgi:hypothetical protein
MKSDLELAATQRFCMVDNRGELIMLVTCALTWMHWQFHGLVYQVALGGVV